VTVSC